MKFLPQVIWLCTAAVLISGCSDEKSRRLPRHSGSPGEILVVMEDENWHGPPGDSLRKVLEAYVPHLPQAEPRFSLLRFRLDQMSDLLKHHRNILEVRVDPDFDPDLVGVKVLRDKWASQQLVFTARSKDKSGTQVLATNQLQRIADIIDEAELNRLIKRYRKFNSKELSALVSEKFGVDMALPEDAELAKEKNDFVWIKRERVKYKANTAHELTQGYFIFRYPYEGEQSLTPEAIMAARDSVLQAHVPGPDPGTHMTTEYRFPPESQITTLNDRYTILTRGLWRMENYFMGGPFACMTTTSDDGNYVVSISGFVFAPNFPKREYIREVDAVIRSARFIDAQKSDA